jgi:hypothetical protein
MKLLVARAACAQRKLLHAVAREARMRVAVDEARDRAATPAVELLDVTVQARELAHAADCRDPTVFAQHERVLDHVHAPQLLTA